MNSATRASVVTLKATGQRSDDVACTVGLTRRAVDKIYARAIARGFDPAVRPLRVPDVCVTDAPRSGRPKAQTAMVANFISQKVRRDRYGREKSCADLAGELRKEGISLSAMTVWRVLKRAGFRKTKPTRKPGLTKKMRNERLEWCRRHESWTLDDWKNVIWSDETSVVLLHRRGGYRVWRKSDERFLRSCIRERWKGASEFMFWGCFSYEKKGPCHCWCPETAREKREAEEAVKRLNDEIEPEMHQLWEVTNGMRRLGLRQKPGKTPSWSWTTKNGKLTRSKRGGIDWYRYQTVILKPKLIPFAKSCLTSRPHTIVQEDKAPAHSHSIQQLVYDREGVERLLWCGNSPDLNAIEPAWPWLKRRTTRQGAPKSRQEAIRAWHDAWEEMPQELIQGWIERIPRHVQEIIKLEGGNEYKEGRG